MHRFEASELVSVAGSLLVLAAGVVSAQAGAVLSQMKIAEGLAGFAGTLNRFDEFGGGIAPLGDLDGDGVADLAVGAIGDFASVGKGAVWILFLNADGTIASEQKIGEASGGFGGNLDDEDHFGASIAALGDLDGDGVDDLAVGAPGDDAGGSSQGAIWILFMNADGTVASERKIAEGVGGFGGVLDANDAFGASVAALGDFDGDGIEDVAVGALGDDDDETASRPNRGALWLLSLNADGTVASERKISATAGGFGGFLVEGGSFGSSVAALGDLDGDGVGDLAVGADGVLASSDTGSVWILFLNADGTVAAQQKIDELEGGFGGSLSIGNRFGSSLAALADLDGDDVVDLAVGADGDSSGDNAGACWILFLDADGTVAHERKIGEGLGGFGGALDRDDRFGSGVAALGDHDHDGKADLAVGARLDDTGGTDQGAVWILFLEGLGPCVTLDFDTEDDLATPLVNGAHVNVEFGTAVTISGAGANAGVGVFDSRPTGPNAAGADPDLLVNSGNVLVLQSENAPPDGNDVFPVPESDDDGGTLSFSFPAPVGARSLRLIGIGENDGTSQVILEDSSALLRTYTVPADWTGERTLVQPGQRTLDLVTLAPQPGFDSVATASEDPGFDVDAVVRIDVVLAGSGAVDDVTWCRAALTHSSVVGRNGTGVNPLLLTNAATPVMGGTWASFLDCSGHGIGLAHLIVKTQPATIPTAFGEILVSGVQLLRRIRPHQGSAISFTQSIPPDLGLVGLAASVQGICTGDTTSLSNALDLVLGF